MPEIQPADGPVLPSTLPKRLNLGCGYDIREGYFNVDLQAFHSPDLVCDITDLAVLPSGYFEEIIASDVLEHLERRKTVPALREWARLLCPGGILDIRVPSLFDMFELLASPERRSNEDAEKIIHLIFGTQAYVGDYHLAGFTAALLSAYLSEAGLLVCKAGLLHDWLFTITARKVDRLTDPVEIVHAAYFQILNRPPDEGGLVRFSRMIAAGEMTQAQLEKMLVDSEEARFVAGNPFYMRRHATHLGKPSEPGRSRIHSLECRLRGILHANPKLRSLVRRLRGIFSAHAEQ